MRRTIPFALAIAVTTALIALQPQLNQPATLDRVPATNVALTDPPVCPPSQPYCKPSTATTNGGLTDPPVCPPSKPNCRAGSR